MPDWSIRECINTKEIQKQWRISLKYFYQKQNKIKPSRANASWIKMLTLKDIHTLDGGRTSRLQTVSKFQPVGEMDSSVYCAHLTSAKAKGC